mgnify:CR=1 FL=1
MTILDRYVVRQFLVTFCFGLLTFVLIFVVIDMMEKLDDFIDANAPIETIVQYYVTFTPEMIPFGVGWFEGSDLQELMLLIESATDISGDLVSAFRRAKDLCMQLRRVYAEDPFMSEKLREIAKVVSRDEVEVVD